MKLSRSNVYTFCAIIITLLNNFLLPYLKLNSTTQLMISELGLLGAGIIIMWIFDAKSERIEHTKVYIDKKSALKTIIAIPFIISIGLLVKIISDSIVLLSGGIVSVKDSTEASGLTVFLILFSGAFVPGIMEEIWYRKIPCAHSNFLLFLLATFSFAANHQGIANIINAIVIAIFSYIILIETKSIIFSVLTHTLFNVAILVENNFTQFMNIDRITSLFMFKSEHILFVVLCSFVALFLFVSTLFLLKPIKCDDRTKLNLKFQKQNIFQYFCFLIFSAIAIFNIII